MNIPGQPVQLGDGAASARRPDGLLLLSSPVVSVYSTQLAELALKHRLPAISLFSSIARAGGLISYSPNLDEAFGETGVMAAKVVNGTKPGDLPAERPTRFELVVNLKTAFGLTIPESSSARRRSDRIGMYVVAVPQSQLLAPLQITHVHAQGEPTAILCHMAWQHICIARFGGPEVLELAEQPTIPDPGPGEVRIKVLAAGTGFTDTFIRRGRYPDFKGPLPFTPGYDLVGVIEETGPGVPAQLTGQLVADLA